MLCVLQWCNYLWSFADSNISAHVTGWERIRYLFLSTAHLTWHYLCPLIGWKELRMGFPIVKMHLEIIFQVTFFLLVCQYCTQHNRLCLQ